MSNSCLKPEKIQEFLEKSLSADEMAAAAMHIKSCPGCQNEVLSFQKVFTMAASTTKALLGQDMPRKSVDRLMQKVQQLHQPGDKISSESKAGTGKGYSLADLLKLVLIPAFGIILLAAFSRSVKLTPQRQENSIQKQFSLSQNSVEVLLGEMKLAENKQISIGAETSLSEGAVILVRAGSHKFKFSAAARFIFNDREVILSRGQASFALNGDHAGLKIITPAVTITPLGTSFEIEAKSWGTRLTLNSGSVEAMSSSGSKRRLNMPGTIYVTTAGAFSEAMPQPEQVEPANYQPPKPIPASSDTGNAPGKLIDSF